MKKYFALVLGITSLITLVASAELFSPGNVVFTDPVFSPDGRIVELKITGNEAEIVNVVRWNLDDTTRRRALGLTIDPNGVVLVGITTTYDGQDNPFPEGIGEILRIDKEGNQKFFTTDVIKSVFLTAVGPDEFILNSNAVADATTAYQYKIEGNELKTVATFNKTGSGEALQLPDGRILMADTATAGILIYDAKGGDKTGVFAGLLDANGAGRFVRTLTYCKALNAVIATLVDGATLIRLDLNGNIEEEFNATTSGFTGIWGVAEIPDSSDLIVSNHNITGMANKFGIFDGKNLSAGPRIITISKGFEKAGLAADTQFASLFNISVIPGKNSSDIQTWDIY